MSALALTLMLLAAAPDASASPQAPARPATVLLFNHSDGYFPLVCTSSQRLLHGDACLRMIRPTAQARTMDGELLTLSRAKAIDVGDQGPRWLRGFTFKTKPAGADALEKQARVTPLERSTLLAVWPATADPGLVAVPIGPPLERDETAVLDLLLRGPPKGPPRIIDNVNQRRFMLLQHVPLADGARAVTYVDKSGTPVLAVKRGEKLPWKVLVTGGHLCHSLRLLATFDLDGDGQREFILLRDNHNGFGIEVRSADLERSLFNFDHGSI